MDPNGNQNPRKVSRRASRGNNNRNDDDDDDNNDAGREVQRRMIRALERRQQSRRGNSNNNRSSNNIPVRPEEAPSSMGNQNAAVEAPYRRSNSNRNHGSDPWDDHAAGAAGLMDEDNAGGEDGASRAFAALPRRNRGAGDDIDDDHDNDNPEDAAANDADNSNPLLKTLLRQLRQFCRDDDRSKKKGPAINVEMARNVLEACAGNVPLAGQLYWDNYFASQVHQHEQQQQQQQQQQQANLPPLDAPSDVAVADPAAEERRVRRRLESDFERLLPHQQRQQAALEEALEARALDSRARQRRRRRSRREDGEDAWELIENPQAAARRNEGRQIGGRRNRNDQHEADADDDDDDDDGIQGILLNELPQEPQAAAAVAPPPPPPRQAAAEDNQALLVAARAVLGAAVGEDAAEGSVNVSDDEVGVAGALRLVRETAKNRRRRDRNAKGANIKASSIRARKINEMMSAKLSAKDMPGSAPGRGRKRLRDGPGGDDGGDSSSSSESDSEGSDDGYLSENDFLLASSDPPDSSPDAPSTQPHQELRAPCDILWGKLAPLVVESKISAKNVPSVEHEITDGEPDTNVEEAKKIKEEAKDANNDDDDEEEEDDNPEDSVGAANKLVIPSTWWHASFSPDTESAKGLALKAPTPEDIAEHSWRIHQFHHPEAAAGSPRRNNTLPMPYHCRGLTAILSIVTALMYTGASVHSNEVTCSTSRAPFLELSDEDRKREFDSRLVDALSALIFVAVRSSTDRKKKAVDKMMARKARRKKRRRQKKEDRGEEIVAEEPDPLEMNMKRKLRLCPVTRWRENTTGEFMTPAEQWLKSEEDESSSPWIQLNTSYSNIADVKAFVLSNMGSFTAHGGVALLLETIVRIHGRGAVERELRRSAAVDKKNATKDEIPDCYSDHPFLVRCTCEERQKKRLQDGSLAARRKLMNATDTTPEGHECVSVELISLLLTGKVHSKLSGWSTGQLGFGMLSEIPGEVGEELSRPEVSPVWVLKGGTCYSVLLLDHTNHGENLNEEIPAPKEAKSKAAQSRIINTGKPKAAPCLKMSLCSTSSRSRDRIEAQSFAKDDRPNFVANLTHWNTWFGVRHLSGLRLITARPKWKPPLPSKVLENYKKMPDAKHAHSLTCRRTSITEQLRERRNDASNVVSSDETETVKTDGTQYNEAAMEKIQFHPEDAKFYPKQHRRWRFDMGAKEGTENDPNAKIRGNHWTPYFSLDLEEQVLVEAKFGPKINRILWSRWPLATIDKFTPGDKNEPLPIV